MGLKPSIAPAIHELSRLEHLHGIEPHSDEIYIALQRRGNMGVNAEGREVSTGDAATIPAGALHGLDNVGEEQSKILMVAIRW